MELGREATFRLLVLHYFQRGDQAFSTGFPHQRMVRQLSPAALQIGADTIMNSLNYALPLHKLDVGNGHGAGDRMTGIGEAMVELPPSSTSTLATLSPTITAPIGR